MHLTSRSKRCNDHAIMNPLRWVIAALVPGCLCLGTLPCLAQVGSPTVIVVPAERTSSLANNEDDAPLGTLEQHFQQIYSSSLLTGLQVGDQITGVGFRVTVDATGVPAQVIPSYSIWMGEAAVSPSLMSLSFAENRGNGFMQVRSGALNITSGLFPGGSGVNALGFIDFTTPFVYQGGNLLIEIAYDEFPAGGRNAEAESDYDAHLAMTAFGHGKNATTAYALYNEALVMGFRIIPIPEPGMAMPCLTGLAFLVYRRKRVGA
jgi:hypothetical protein